MDENAVRFARGKSAGSSVGPRVEPPLKRMEERSLSSSAAIADRERQASKPVALSLRDSSCLLLRVLERERETKWGI